MIWEQTPDNTPIITDAWKPRILGVVNNRGNQKNRKQDVRGSDGHGAESQGLFAKDGKATHEEHSSNHVRKDVRAWNVVAPCLDRLVIRIESAPDEVDCTHRDGGGAKKNARKDSWQRPIRHDLTFVLTVYGCLLSAAAVAV